MAGMRSSLSIGDTMGGVGRLVRCDSVGGGAAPVAWRRPAPEAVDSRTHTAQPRIRPLFVVKSVRSEAATYIYHIQHPHA